MPDFITTCEGLDTSHLAELNLVSAISEDRIRQRYYQSVTADQLPSQFADYQRRDGLRDFSPLSRALVTCGSWLVLCPVGICYDSHDETVGLCDFGSAAL